MPVTARRAAQSPKRGAAPPAPAKRAAPSAGKKRAASPPKRSGKKRATSPARSGRKAPLLHGPPPAKWASAKSAHRQLLPRDTAFCRLPRAQAPEGPAWPAADLFFKRWVDDEADDLVHDVLVERGWTFRGDVADPEQRLAKLQSPHFAQMDDMVAGRRTTPRRCVWLIDLPDAKHLCDLSGGAAKHRINTFVGTEASCFKTSFTKAFRGESFWPESFVLPGERKEMIARLGKPCGHGTEYWAVKPKNDFGGEGITVHPAGAHIKELRDIISRPDAKRYVAQRYISKPLLVGGYKFHLRIHTLLTDVHPCRAYMHHDGHVMFATKPYSLHASTLGEKFDKFTHLTNYSINATKENEAGFLGQKGIVGPGTMWSVKFLFEYLRTSHGVDIDRIWSDIARVSAKVMRHVSSYSTTKRGSPGRHYELFGLDMMLDENLKLWLLEGNNSVGIEYCGSHIPEKKFEEHVGMNYEVGKRQTPTTNPDKFSDEVLKQVVHDTYAILGIDGKGKRGCGRPDNWVVLDGC